MRLAYIIDCMNNSGGMERVLSVCANALCDVYDVTIITAFQKGLPDFFELDFRIIRYDLGIHESANIRQKKREYKKALSAYLLVEHFDVVISMGGMDFDFLCSILDGSKKVFWFHFAIDVAKTTWTGPNPSAFQVIKAQLQTWKRIYYARKYDQIVVISKADLKTWKKYTDKATHIYNPITINATRISDRTEKSVISVGRLDFQKGYDYLIPVWNLISQKHPDWHLNIYGEGPLRESIQTRIDELKLGLSVTLCGRTPNIGDQYAAHSIYVMSSRAEGLGLVLLEAAFCGLPLVAFDCPSGPSEIIEDGKNGFLIKKVGDVQTMADRICQLIEDEELRKQMGEKAKLMVQRFSVNTIRKQWIALIDSVLVTKSKTGI